MDTCSWLRQPGYIGDDIYDPIWSALDARGAIIFIHGTQTPASTPIPHPTLGLPVTEVTPPHPTPATDVTSLPHTHDIHLFVTQVPHETFKAASQLVVSGKTRRFSRLEIILAHMGGSTLALAPRVAGLARYMGATLSEDEILIEFRRFWWDTALSGGAPLMAAVSTCGAETWSFGDRILWGSDFPGE
jgi:6-methylsalicylate decarboxylase